MIETGTIGNDRVWIGVSNQNYDFAQSELTRRKVHIFNFSVSEAEAAVAMLKSEIARQKRKAKREANK